MADAALALLMMLLCLGLMTREAEGAVGKQPADRRRIMAFVAAHVCVNRRGVISLHVRRAVAARAGPCGRMMILVAGSAVRGVGSRRERDRLGVAIGTARVGVRLVGESDLAGSRFALRHGKPGRHRER